MFVSEGGVLSTGCVKVRISTLDGLSVLLSVDPNWSCDALKLEAVSQLFDTTESCKMSLSYNLLHIRTGKIIDGELTLRQIDLADDDDLIVVKRRVRPLSFTQPKDDTSPPTVDDINKATANLQSVNSDRTAPESGAAIDFQTELRKILVSLIDVAQKLICLNVDDIKEARKYVFCENAPNSQAIKSSVDESSLQQLMEMGFDRAKATKALLVNRMSYMRAVQWLLDNIDDDNNEPTIAELSITPPAPLPAMEPTADHSAGAVAAGLNNNVESELFELAKLSGAAKVQRMLDAFKCYKRRVFKPDARALQSLLEMGFDEPLAVDALRMYNNSKDEACDWLLNRESDASSPTDFSVVEEGLDTNSSIYKAIVSNHVIQLSLTSHKTLIALLHILENPSVMQQWLRDADLNPMLVQISRIYHAEKYGR